MKKFLNVHLSCIIVSISLVFLSGVYYYFFNDYLISKATPEINDPCLNLSGVYPRLCHQKTTEIIARQEGITSASAYVKEVTKKVPTGGECHLLMHILGDLSFKIRPNATLSELIKGADLYCTGGYLHGLLEAYFTAHKEEPDPGNFIAACDSTLGKDPFVKSWECFHGLGHALMYDTKNDIFKSAHYCDLLVQPWTRQRCLYGVFMENSYQHMSWYHGPERRFIDKDNLLYPCTAVADKYKDACYKFPGRSFILELLSDRQPQSAYQGVMQGAVKVSPEDFKQAFKICQSIQGPETYRKNCLADLSIYIQIAYPLRSQWGEAKKTCEQLDSVDYKQLCFDLTAKEVRRYDNTNQGLAEDFCYQLDYVFRSHCYKTIHDDSWYNVPTLE